MPQKTSTCLYEIRADFDTETIVVYQAFSAAIADAALAAGGFVAPFSFGRMTWIKPSFLWLMERSNWAQKSGQERILAVRLRRAGWDEALSVGVLTHPVGKIHGSAERWEALFAAAPVHVQWDPERTLRGAALGHYAIQVGISRHLIDRYVSEWIVEITDKTPTVRRIHALLAGGKADKAKAFLPAERVYPVTGETGKRLGMG
jgi:hypothetical protein